MPVTDDYEIIWEDPNEGELMKLLVEEHNFSEERVENVFKQLTKDKEEKQQKGLGEFF